MARATVKALEARVAALTEEVKRAHARLDVAARYCKELATRLEKVEGKKPNYHTRPCPQAGKRRLG